MKITSVVAFSAALAVVAPSCRAQPAALTSLQAAVERGPVDRAWDRLENRLEASGGAVELPPNGPIPAGHEDDPAGVQPVEFHGACRGFARCLASVPVDAAMTPVVGASMALRVGRDEAGSRPPDPLTQGLRAAGGFLVGAFYAVIFAVGDLLRAAGQLCVGRL